MKHFLRFGVIGGLAMAMPFAWAQDAHNLSEGHPTSIEDAYPVPEGEQQFLLGFIYESSDDFDISTLTPGFQMGMARDWHLRVVLPFVFTDDDSDVGDLRLQAFWGNKGMNDPDTAFAAAFEILIPVDDDAGDDDDIDTRLKFILTHPLENSPNHGRVHFNLDILGGDVEGVSFAAGYSQLLGTETSFVADIVRFDPEIGSSSNMLEFGLKRQMNPNSFGSLGLRLGLNDNAPDFGLLLGWQARL